MELPNSTEQVHFWMEEELSSFIHEAQSLKTGRSTWAGQVHEKNRSCFEVVARLGIQCRPGHSNNSWLKKMLSKVDVFRVLA